MEKKYLDPKPALKENQDRNTQEHLLEHSANIRLTVLSSFENVFWNIACLLVEEQIDMNPETNKKAEFNEFLR